MTIQEKKLTVDQFWELAQQPHYQDKQLELIDGELVVMSPSSGRNSGIAVAIASLIYFHVKQHNLGSVTGADGGYEVGENTVLVPDVGFIQQARIPDGDFVFYPVPPDLAVEVISPSETRLSIQHKTRLYLEAGTQIVWNVYPEGETVDVVTLDENDTLNIAVLQTEQTIDGGEVLPGFSAEVKDFFA